jgi:molybdopterin synthase catalytic subunit
MLKELAGTAVHDFDLPERSSSADLLRLVSAGNARIAGMLAVSAVAVNQQYAGPETVLHEGDEVALMPPVSGGSGAESLRSAHCALVRERIDAAELLSRIKRGDDGAAVVFDGVVRNNTRGRRTLYLEYEAYEEMALRQMEALAGKALGQFPVRDVAIVHRLGRLEIGETSVLIVVASAHRAAAFEACRWLIDTLKRTVPIWKKEHFEDGAVWADGEPFPDEIARASPQ